MARLRNSAGIIEWTRGRHEQALTHFEQALPLFDELADAAGAGQMMNSIALCLHALGRHAAAQERLQHALAHHQRTGHAQLEAHAMSALGDMCWEAGNTGEASSWYATLAAEATSPGRPARRSVDAAAVGQSPRRERRARRRPQSADAGNRVVGAMRRRRVDGRL